METKNPTTEQAILEAAEQEFLDKGFAGAKTPEIAKRAGVNHAMLHYYFRTKENLFNIILQKKMALLANSFMTIFDSNLPFLDKIRIGMEKHLDFISENSRLPLFIVNESTKNEKNKLFLIDTLQPKVTLLLEKIRQQIEIEAEKGLIKHVKAEDLLYNIITLNVMTGLGKPMLKTVCERTGTDYEQYMAMRRESNIRFILDSLKK